MTLGPSDDTHNINTPTRLQSHTTLSINTRLVGVSSFPAIKIINFRVFLIKIITCYIKMHYEKLQNVTSLALA